MRKFLLTLTAAAALPALALASDDTKSSDMSSHGMSGHDSSGHDMSSHDMSSHDGMEGVHADATLNSLDGDTANITHGPIAEIGWPAMTMDLPLLDGAEVTGVAAGDDVMMMLEKGADGMYGIRALMPRN